MNGYDAQRYEICKEKAFNLGMDIQTKGKLFTIQKYGTFETTDELFFFLCGYEWASRETQ